MESYNIDTSKRKKALKQVVKNNIKNTKGFPKFCCGFTIALRILACVLGLGNILYVFFLSDYIEEIIYLITTFGIPFVFSFISAFVYQVSCGGEFRFRKNESITLVNGGFVYSYHDDRVGANDTVFSFNVMYEKLQNYKYDEQTQEIALYGNIGLDTYENGKLKESEKYNGISLLNIFDVDVKELLEKNNIKREQSAERTIK